MSALIGRKVGMTQVFDEDGNLVPVTVLEMGPNTVVQVKTSGGKDGYDALKVGFEPVDVRKLNRPDGGVFHRAGLEPMKVTRELRLGASAVAAANKGDVLHVSMYHPGQNVDVIGTSKGRGYQGVVKRHGFKGAKEATHGTHEYKRHSGSIGCSTFPGRVIKGKKMAGQMGDVRVTVPSLKVVAVYPDDNLLLVRGAVPGGHNGLVMTRLSARQPKVASA